MAKITKARLSELLNSVIDHMCVAEKVSEVIRTLIGIGFTEEELREFGFTASDIAETLDAEEDY